jgi:hypothetical protein
MSMDRTIILRLRVIAAKAEQMAEDAQKNKLWPDDLKRGLNEIGAQLEQAQREAKQ